MLKINPWKLMAMILSAIFMGLIPAMAALQAVGWTMPWNAIPRAEAAIVYETKESAKLHYDEIEQQHQQVLLDISQKLDTLARSQDHKKGDH